jgi:nucleoside 2-deoxyribosyltransferase
MRLTGILGNSLNGQLCLRGFAKIKDLARVSKADYTYQRNPIDRSDISDFLEKQTYLFFPEVILGYKVKSKGSESAIKLIQEGKKAKSEEGTFTIKKINGETEKYVTIEIDEAINSQPFSRIDGNHRLLAAEKSTNPKVENMVAPYCLLLGEDTTDFDKATKVFFHNINTKTIPLTSEENLRVLIDDEKNFTNDELVEIFGGKHPIKTRELVDKAKPEIFGNIQHIIKDQYRTYLNNTFWHLLEDGEDENKIIDKVVNSLQAVNTLYGSEPQLKANDSLGILTAFLYYHVKDESAKFDMFKNWILNNQIFNAKEVSVKSIINIFDNIIASEMKVFVAMPFFDEKVIEDYNYIYSNTIKKIAENYSINISLYPIMNNKGATQDQIQDIINKIKECKICIADITDNNPNVSYEMGWARALKKDVIIVKRKGSVEPKSDYKNDTYHEYDDSARSTDLARIISENIIEVLEKNYGLIKK